MTGVDPAGLGAEMLSATIAFLLLLPATFALWPIPRQLAVGTSPLKLSPSFFIHTSISNPPSDLLSAITRTQSQLRNDTFQRLVLGRASADTEAIVHAPSLSSLVLTINVESHAPVRSIADETTSPIENKSESYSLNIPKDGSPATIVANSTLGLFRGLTTFGQMWYASGLQASLGGKYILNAPVKIVDEPAFPHRGLSFDTARNL